MCLDAILMAIIGDAWKGIGGVWSQKKVERVCGVCFAIIVHILLQQILPSLNLTERMKIN